MTGTATSSFEFASKFCTVNSVLIQIEAASQIEAAHGAQ